MMKTMLLLLGVMPALVFAGLGDVPILGMGGMSLVWESDMNRLDMYDFGQNPAGLLRAMPARFAGGEQMAQGAGGGEDALSDYSYVDGYATVFGTSGVDSLFHRWAVGQPLPNELQNFLPIPMGEFVNFETYPSEPLGAIYRSRNLGVASSYGLSWSHAAQGRSLTVNTPTLNYQRSGTLGSLDYGAEASAFYFMGSAGGATLNFLGPGVGLGIASPGESFGWGVDAHYFHPWFDMSSPSVKINGSAVVGGGTMLFHPSDPLKVGVRAGYKWTKVDVLKFMSPWLDARAIYQSAESPMVYGGDLSWGDVNTSYPTFHYASKLDTLGLGFGVGARTTDWFAGCEAHFSSAGARLLDSLATNTLVLQAGSEVTLGATQLRLGFGRTMTIVPHNPGYYGTPGSYVLTAGAGMELNGLHLDIAYNLISGLSDANEHLLYVRVGSGSGGTGGLE
jgi:hypothetical protein